LARIAAVLRPGGALLGHSVIEPGSTYAYARQGFADAEDLASLLASAFPHVCARTTRDSLRLNVCFFAGTGPEALPFDAGRDDVIALQG
jgi:hypothetical protein